MAAALQLGPVASHIKTAALVVSVVASYGEHRQVRVCFPLLLLSLPTCPRSHSHSHSHSIIPLTPPQAIAARTYEEDGFGMHVPCCCGRLLGRGDMKDQLTK